MAGSVSDIGEVVDGGTFGGSTVTFESDGDATGTSYSGNASWYSPTTAGIGSSHWVRTTKTGGVGSAVIDPADGAWNSLTAGVTWTVSGGAVSYEGTVEVATDSGGSSIVGTGTLVVSNLV